jgi:PhnB protein
VAHTKIEMLAPELQVSDLDFYLTVGGVDESFATALAAGASELLPLEDRWYGMRDARVADPDGNQIGLGQPLERQS